LPKTPEIRIRKLNGLAPAPGRNFVLYLMTVSRRLSWNFALDRAVEWAQELSRPLLIVECLECGGRWDSERSHAFVLAGMAQNAKTAARKDVSYYPFVEKSAGESDGLLTALAARACVVIGDDFPLKETRRKWAARDFPAPVELVDSNGILPLREANRVFPTAYAFRRFLQRELLRHLDDFPQGAPFRGKKKPALRKLSAEITKRFPPADPKLLATHAHALAKLPIDHQVQEANIHGGPAAAQKTWRSFLYDKLPRYIDDRNQPEADATSGLSPYLHHGHISPHQIVAELLDHEDWDETKLASTTRGQKQGWWGLTPAAEAFLDQLITWREIGYNFCALRDDYEAYESLPDWAQETLETHASDRRPDVYDLPELESAHTHDPLWNAAQTQLAREGRLHNYLRMLWGKKILEWSPSPKDALEAMIHLNNKYALDAPNPNSYSGLLWCLGRYDRPWGPERPIFGKIRYMSSDNTRRKLYVKDYIRKYTP